MTEQPTTKPDWRSLPRKPLSDRRHNKVCLRLTDEEKKNLVANAKAAKRTPQDLIVVTCCQPE